MKSIYERMAVTKLMSSSTYSRGEFPARTWVARFVFTNGLIAEYDGEKWSVAQAETV